MKSGLSRDELAQIRAILETVPSVDKAVLFGSRAMGLARANSDVDIMLYGDELKMQDIMQISSLLEETTLPYQFDLIHHDAENPALLEHVRQYGKVIFQRGMPSGKEFWRKREGEIERGRLGMKRDKQELDSILELLKASIAAFYEKDKNLLTIDRKNRRGMERASAFRIGHYLCNHIKDTELYCYDVDMEYNKNGVRPKCDLNGKKQQPDLIIHKRLSNKQNLLVVEFKHGSDRDVSRDVDKLRGFTAPEGEYKYRMGVLVELCKEYQRVRYRYFRDGQEVFL